MISPIISAGRVYLKDEDFLIRFRCQEYFIACRDAARSWPIGTPGCKVETSDAETVGEFSRFDTETFSLVLNKHRYLIPEKDLRDVLAMRQTAAPVIDAEPGQQVLFEGLVAA